MKTKQLRRHIRKIRFNWFLICFFSLIAAICIIGSVYLTNYCYNKWLSPSGTAQERSEQIQRSIGLHPSRSEGYHTLLNAYLEDGLLTEEESHQLTEVLQQYQARLNKMPEEANVLYRRIAFAYLSSFDGDTTARFKMGYRYFERSRDYAGSDPLDQTAADTYLTIGSYCSEYLWLTGSLKEPNATEISGLIRRLSALLDSYAQGDDDKRLAFACTVADLMTDHGQLWVRKLGTDTVAALADKVAQQVQKPTSGNAAQRLKDELTAWAIAEHPWEVS